MVRSRKIPTSLSNSTAATTDQQFAFRLRENGVVYLHPDTIAPEDLKLMKSHLDTTRDVPRSTKAHWKKLVEAKRCMTHSELSFESMITESMLVHHASPYNYLRYRGDHWSEVDNEITAGMSDPKPNITEAYTWTAYPPGTRDNLDELVVSQYGYSMPTFAVEFQGTSSEEAVRRAAYDGAVMTHAALAIDRHVGKDLKRQNRKVKAITVTLSDTDICVYANHAVFSEDQKKPTYHQYRVSRIHYADSEAEWENAYSLLVNAQQLGLQLANLRIADLNSYTAKENAETAAIKGDAVEKAKAASTAPPTPQRLSQTQAIAKMSPPLPSSWKR